MSSASSQALVIDMEIIDYFLIRMDLVFVSVEYKVIPARFQTNSLHGHGYKDWMQMWVNH